MTEEIKLVLNDLLEEEEDITSDPDPLDEAFMQEEAEQLQYKRNLRLPSEAILCFRNLKTFLYKLVLQEVMKRLEQPCRRSQQSRAEPARLSHRASFRA